MLAEPATAEPEPETMPAAVQDVAESIQREILRRRGCVRRIELVRDGNLVSGEFRAENYGPYVRVRAKINS